MVCEAIAYGSRSILVLFAPLYKLLVTYIDNDLNHFLDALKNASEEEYFLGQELRYHVVLMSSNISANT